MTSAQLQVFDVVFGLGLGDIPGTFDRMSGAGYGAMTSSAVQSNQTFAQTVHERMNLVRTGGASVQTSVSPALAFGNDNKMQVAAGLAAANAEAADPTMPSQRSGWSAWAQSVGSATEVGADGSGPAWSSRGGGVVFGFDKVFNSSFLLGMAGFYSNNVITTDGLRGTNDNYSAVLYGSWTRGGFELDGLLGGGWSNFSAERTLNSSTSTSARGSTSGAGVIASTEVGYRYAFLGAGPVSYVKPFLGFSYNSLQQREFTESGGGAFDLAFGSTSLFRTMSRLGAAVGFGGTSTDGWVVQPELRIAWGHDFEDMTPWMSASILGSSFTAQDAQPGRDGALIGLQLSAFRTEALQVFGGYHGDLRSNGMTHSGNIGLRVHW
jgi:outer membrane autotransporter protein